MTEKVMLGRALEALERPKAQERRIDGNIRGGQVGVNFTPTSKTPKSSGRVRDLLREMELHPGGQPKKNRSHDVTGSPTLEEVGISKMQSSRWQR